MTGKSRKILLVSHSQKSGGAEKCLAEMATGLRERGYLVEVLLPSRGELYELLVRDEIKVITSPYPWWVHFRTEKITLLRRTLSQIKYLLSLLGILRKSRPDIVLTNTLCVGVAGLASWLLSIRHMWFIHEFGEEDHGLVFDFGIKRSTRVISGVSNHVFVNSVAVKEKFEKFIPSAKMSVVNYDIRAPRAPINYQVAGNLTLLMVGQITVNKGQMDAVQSLVILRKKYPGIRLIIVGQVSDASYFRMLQEYITSEGVDEHVKFVGHTSSPFDYAQPFTVGLMCSEWEALGRVTVEYMKIGIPVIGARSSTTATIIRDNETGLLYRLRDPDDLARCIDRVAGSLTFARRLSTKAMAYANQHYNSHTFMLGITKFL